MLMNGITKAFLVASSVSIPALNLRIFMASACARSAMSIPSSRPIGSTNAGRRAPIGDLRAAPVQPIDPRAAPVTSGYVIASPANRTFSLDRGKPGRSRPATPEHDPRQTGDPT
ncbi:hypothetical protein GCM10010428_25230 [Actinosynnema pretiosum subsp. pretiosum]